MKRTKDIFDLKKVNVELRENESGKTILSGLIPFNSFSQDLGGFKEKILPTAFNKTVQEQDVKCLVNHDTSKVLGRVKNNTLKLSIREDGLLCEVELPNTTYANDLIESIKRDDVSTMSFGFQTVKDNWDYNKKPAIRDLIEVRLLEVSYGVVFPAYEETQSYVINRDLYSTRGIDIDDLSNVFLKIDNKTELDENDLKKIKDYINILSEMLPVKEEEIKEEVQEEKKEEEQSSTDTDSVMNELDLKEKYLDLKLKGVI